MKGDRYRLRVSPYKAIFRDVILTTFALLPDIAARRAFAVGMVLDSDSTRMAMTWAAVEDSIVDGELHL
jgi:hypothetical protein